MEETGESSSQETKKNDLNRKLVCIEYPGLVKNEENMIKTLGGLNKLSEAFNQDKRRLELRFRPDSVYCKPAFGDRSATTGLLMKVKIRRNKNDPTDVKTETQVLGLIEDVYKFESLCDFQYLPISTKNEPNAKAECIYKDVVPEGILSTQWIEDKNNVPYFLPPISFSRLDSVQERLFRKENQKDPNSGSAVIGKTRMRRSKHATYYNFDLQSPVPVKPHPTALSFLKLKFIPTEKYNLIKELFQKRPIWSKMAIEYESKISGEQLKYILPSLAYYMTTGPWRVLWIRFGYDASKHFESRHFQTLDYRVRNAIGMKNYVKLKRGYTIHKPNMTQKVKNATVIETSQAAELNTKKKDAEIYYPFFELGTMPQSRQCFYQYCDLRVPKIQEMLEKLPTPSSGAVCNEKTGWLASSFDDQVRDIITESIKEAFQNDLLKQGEDQDFENEDYEEDFEPSEDEDAIIEDQMEDMEIDDE